MTQVCIDAGLVIKLITLEPDTHEAEVLFQQWRAEHVELIAPAFAAAEVDSVLRGKVVKGAIPPDEAEAAFQLAERLPIQFELAADCRRRAWELAVRFGFRTVYDAVYLALAEQRGGEFWTADGKLYERVKDQLRFVRLLGRLPGG